MNYQTILLTGIPRSGSTLCCHLLNSYDNTLALHEPMDVSQLKTEQGSLGVCQSVSDFAFQSRKNVLYHSTVTSKHQHGVIPDNPVQTHSHDNSLRQVVVSSGDITLNREFSRAFSLIIKHNALFTATLADLLNFFPCYGIIRNPLAVLASWSTVELPVNQGRIPVGERFAPELKQRLDETDNVIARQLLVMDWFFHQFQRYLSQEQIIRYESLISDSHKLLAPLSYNGHKQQSTIQLRNNNANSQYHKAELSSLYNALIESDGAYWQFYNRNEVEQLYKQLLQS